MVYRDFLAISTVEAALVSRSAVKRKLLATLSVQLLSPPNLPSNSPTLNPKPEMVVSFLLSFHLISLCWGDQRTETMKPFQVATGTKQLQKSSSKQLLQV